MYPKWHCANDNVCILYVVACLRPEEDAEMRQVFVLRWRSVVGAMGDCFTPG